MKPYPAQLAVLACLGAICLSAAAQDAGPDQDQQAPATGEAVLLFYDNRIEQAVSTITRTDDLALAGEMTNTAMLEQTPLELRKALLVRSTELAMKDRRGYDQAERSARLLVQAEASPGGEGDRLLTEVLELALRAADSLTRKQAATKLARQYIRHGRAMAEAKDPAGAIRLYRKAQGLTTLAGDEVTSSVRTHLGEAAWLQGVLNRSNMLTRQLEQSPDDMSLRRRLVLLTLLEMGDPSKAVEIWQGGPDPALSTYLPLAARDAGQLAPMACLELARWYRSLGQSGSQQARDLAMDKALSYYDLFLDKHKAQDAPHIQAIQERDELYEKLVQGMALSLVLWNQHNGTHNDRGTLSVNVLLYHKGRLVHRAESIDLQWKAGQDVKNTIALPPRPCDRIRIEVTKFHNVGGGLAEIQLFRGRDDLAAGQPARASAAYSPIYSAGRVTDGVTSSARGGHGYWLLPDRRTGWVEVDLKQP
ncbi:MAG: hypothetical protein ACLFUJ_05520 [Phycisphaerae bacterium]